MFCHSHPLDHPCVVVAVGEIVVEPSRSNVSGTSTACRLTARVRTLARSSTRRNRALHSLPEHLSIAAVSVSEFSPIEVDLVNATFGFEYIGWVLSSRFARQVAPEQRLYFHPQVRVALDFNMSLRQQTRIPGELMTRRWCTFVISAEIPDDSRVRGIGGCDCGAAVN